MKILSTLEKSLSGWPDTALTLILIVWGIAFILIALFGYRTLKLGAALYALF